MRACATAATEAARRCSLDICGAGGVKFSQENLRMAMPKVLNAVPNSVNKVAREVGSLRNAAREAASYKSWHLPICGILQVARLTAAIAQCSVPPETGKCA